MRDFECVACKIRTRRAVDTAPEAGDACPGCGSPLEPVGELLVGDFTAHRNALYAQRVSDALATLHTAGAPARR